MNKLRFAAAAVIVILLLGAAGAGAFAWFVRTVAAPGPLQGPVTLVIATGSGLPTIARQVAAAGVIAAPWMMELEARRLGQARALKPGEYRFEPGISIDGVLGKIVRRDVVAHFVTIPEGLVTADIRDVILRAEALSGAITASIADGDLLPETYRYEWGDTRDGLINRMRAARDAAVAELWESRAPDLPLPTPEQAVILASIVEKETGVASERPQVAAVFINRMKRGMRLQSDPTVIYGLAPAAGDLGRPLTKADLEHATPYNTYVISGLPPSPICHPGRAALAAVFAPETSANLYFVADGTGGHVFAATLEEHNRNVARWRRLEQNRPH